MRSIKYNELIERAVSAVKGRLANANKQVVVQTDIDSTAGLEITVNPERLMQVITNLLDNAVKFTE